MFTLWFDNEYILQSRFILNLLKLTNVSGQLLFPGPRIEKIYVSGGEWKEGVHSVQLTCLVTRDHPINVTWSHHQVTVFTLFRMTKVKLAHYKR